MAHHRCIDCPQKLKNSSTVRCQRCHRLWMDSNNVKITRQCKTCGSVVRTFPSENRWFCSQTCANRYNAKQKPVWNKGMRGIGGGEKHWNWKGGITTQDRSERQRFRKLVQSRIFARDSYTCQICQASGVPIQVDHIKDWAKYPKLRFDLDNCRTLCMACHYYVTFKKKLPQGVVWGHNLNRRTTS